MTDFIFVLTRQVEPTPGFIVGPIARVFGFLIDFLYEAVYFLTPTTAAGAHTLGFTIILMTIVFRFLMLPLSLKSQKSMNKMREIKPELDKISEKYGKSKDPELMKKANAERSALMAKHGANPLSGCLPMLIQMPLFVGLTFIMRQAFLYVSRLHDLYLELSATLINIGGLISPQGMIQRLGVPLIPQNMIDRGPAVQALVDQGFTLEQAMEQVGEIIALGVPEHLSRVINRFSTYDWDSLFYGITLPDGTVIDGIYQLSPAVLSGVQEMVSRLRGIETFFGLHIVENGGWGWPGIIIPVLVAITMFGSSWLMQQRMHDPNADDKVKLQQKIMLFVMPLVMAFFTVSFPMGVGIFWITSQVFQIVQDLILFKRAGIKIKLPFMKAKES